MDVKNSNPRTDFFITTRKRFSVVKELTPLKKLTNLNRYFFSEFHILRVLYCVAESNDTFC